MQQAGTGTHTSLNSSSFTLAFSRFLTASQLALCNSNEPFSKANKNFPILFSVSQEGGQGQDEELLACLLLLFSLTPFPDRPGPGPTLSTAQQGIHPPFRDEMQFTSPTDTPRESTGERFKCRRTLGYHFTCV